MPCVGLSNVRMVGYLFQEISAVLLDLAYTANLKHHGFCDTWKCRLSVRRKLKRG